MRNNARHRIAHEIYETSRWDDRSHPLRNMRNFGKFTVARRRLASDCGCRRKMIAIPILTPLPATIETEEVQLLLPGHGNLRMDVEVVVHARCSALHRADADHIRQRHQFPPLAFSSGSPRLASSGSRQRPPRRGWIACARTGGDETR